VAHEALWGNGNLYRPSHSVPVVRVLNVHLKLQDSQHRQQPIHIPTHTPTHVHRVGRRRSGRDGGDGWQRSRGGGCARLCGTPPLHDTIDTFNTANGSRRIFAFECNVGDTNVYCHTNGVVSMSAPGHGVD
jgi:hypothetical protein